MGTPQSPGTYLTQQMLLWYLKGSLEMGLVETGGTGNWPQFSQWMMGTEGLQWEFQLSKNVREEVGF